MQNCLPPEFIIPKKTIQRVVFIKTPKTHNTLDSPILQEIHKIETAEVSIPHSTTETMIKKEEPSKPFSKPYKCYYCLETFTWTFFLEQHIKNNHPDGKPICVKCGLECKSLEQLKKHLWFHNAVNCHKCNLQFSDLKKYTKHYTSTHIVSKTATCETCGKTMVKSSMRRHMEEVHKEKEKYQCDQCPKFYYSKMILQNHVKHVHDKISKNVRPKQIICEICGKAISDLHCYQTHLNIHNGIKPYECDTCGKTFASKSGLKVHVLIHTGEKPHRCRYCEKSFSQHNTLTSHERIHTGERPFECHVCAKSFVSKSVLTAHVKSKHRVVNITDKK